MRHWFIAAMLVLAVPIAAPVASPAWADRKAECEDKAHPNVVIPACTSIIDNPNLYRDSFTEDSIASAYANRGVAYQDLGNDVAALSDYAMSLKLDPSKITYFNRANLYFRRGEWGSVLSDAKAGLKLGDASSVLSGLSAIDALLTFFKGRALEELGTKGEAIIELRKAYHASESSTNDNLKDVHELSAKHLKAMGASTDTPSLFDFNPLQSNPPRTNLPPVQPIKPAPPNNFFPSTQPPLVPLSPADIQSIQQARKIQCVFHPELCR